MKIEERFLKTEKCGKCGNDNIPWGTSTELWNEICDNHKDNICPQCFIKLAKKKLNFNSVYIGFNAEKINR